MDSGSPAPAMSSMVSVREFVHMIPSLVVVFWESPLGSGKLSGKDSGRSLEKSSGRVVEGSGKSSAEGAGRCAGRGSGGAKRV